MVTDEPAGRAAELSVPIQAIEQRNPTRLPRPDDGLRRPPREARRALGSAQQPLLGARPHRRHARQGKVGVENADPPGRDLEAIARFAPLGGDARNLQAGCILELDLVAEDLAEAAVDAEDDAHPIGAGLRIEGGAHLPPRRRFPRSRKVAKGGDAIARVLVESEETVAAAANGAGLEAGAHQIPPARAAGEIEIPRAAVRPLLIEHGDGGASRAGKRLAIRDERRAGDAAPAAVGGDAAERRLGAALEAAVKNEIRPRIRGKGLRGNPSLPRLAHRPSKSVTA